MSKILKFKLDLLVVRFKIKGFFNVASLIIVLAGLLIGAKVIQHNLGNYEQLSVLLGLFIYVFFCKYIFVSDFEMKWKQVVTYFNSFSDRDVKKYYLYKNLIIFLAVIIFVLLPTNFGDVSLFLLYLVGINILLFIQIFARNLFCINKYSAFILIFRIILCGILILYLKNYQFITIKTQMNWYGIFICLILITFIIIEEFKLIKVSSNKNRGLYAFVNLSKKLPLFKNNSDVLYAVRTSLLIEPLLIIVCGNIVINRNLGDWSGNLFTLIISYLCSYSSIYRMLIKNEERKLIYFFQGVNPSKLKLAKIKNTVYLSTILFFMTLIPLFFLLPLYFIILGYILSLAIFIVGGIFIKIEAEKHFNYRILLTDKNILIFILVQIIMGFCVSYVAAPEIISYIGGLL